jgi:hypothetical protein
VRSDGRCGITASKTDIRLIAGGNAGGHAYWLVKRAAGVEIIAEKGCVRHRCPRCSGQEESKANSEVKDFFHDDLIIGVTMVVQSPVLKLRQ